MRALLRAQLHRTTWNLCWNVLRICTFPELFVGAQLPSCSCPPPGSPLLPFSKICQALFDADPFPAKVRFLLFHQSRLQNLAPPAFSCFLSKRKCCFASVFFFFFFPLLSSLLPLPHLPLGQIWNTDCKNVACVGQVLISKNEKSSLKKKERYPPFFGLLLHELPHKHRQQHPHWFCVLYSNVPPLSDQPCWCVCWCVVTCDPRAKLSHGASARSLFCYRRENSSLYAGSVGSYVWSA